MAASSSPRSSPFILAAGTCLIGLQLTVILHLVLDRDRERRADALRSFETRELHGEIQAVREAMLRLRSRAIADLDSAVTSLKSAFDLRLREAEDRLLSPALQIEEEVTGLGRFLREEGDARAAQGRAVESALHGLHARLDAPSASRTLEERFQAIQAAAEPSLFLVHCEFTYLTRVPGEDGVHQAHTGSGSGTAFAVGPDGLLATNKHVVQPWKFDSELLALVALGQSEVLEGSVRITAWPSGARSKSAGGSSRYTPAFDNHSTRNLSVLAVAPDTLVPRTATVGGVEVAYEIHDFDDNDLAILKIEGSTPPALPLAADPGVAKLDPVMALGFPRGQRGIEAGSVESSPSLGTVRKVQDTIHITASIIPGNSGGPVFNLAGEVVGVATRIYSETLGICIKAGKVRELLEPVLQRMRPEEGHLARPR